jgi:post-segregation antitoxin (ccd killing protein)
MARFTVYLPDDLRERGRAADLNFSEILRNGVIAMLRTVEVVDAGDSSTASTSSS